MRGRADIVLLFVSPHLSSEQIRKLRTFPPILTGHGNTAGLRVAGIETSRTASLVEEPTPESDGLTMSRLRLRERIISSCVGLAPPSLNVCTRKSQTYMCFFSECRPMTENKQLQRYCCNSPQVLGTHGIHTLVHLEIDKPPS